MNELLPCPFCGGEAELSNYDGIVANGSELKVVACVNQSCLASVWARADDVVITAWNRRYQTPTSD